MNSVTKPDTCRCPMCGPTEAGSRSLVWSTAEAALDIDTDTEQWVPSHEAVVVGD